MKKRTLLSATLAFISIAIMGCDQLAPVEETSTGSDTEYQEKMSGNSRAGSWVKEDHQYGLANCRDIAAANDVAVISNDGKSIWFKGGNSSTFEKIQFSSNDQARLNSDPAVKIEMGIKESRTLAPGVGLWDHIAYISTESGKLYEIEAVFPNGGEQWYLNLENETGPTVGADFCITANNSIFLVNTNSVFEKVGTTWKHIAMAYGQIEAISDKTVRTSDKSSTCLIYVTDSNEMHRIVWTQYGYQVKDVYCGTHVPSKDVEQAFTTDAYNEVGFATFENNTNNVNYLNRRTGVWESIGSCRKIAIDNNMKLWDAYTGGIWSKQI